ncbi:Stk1 family PASTA domain-containing Ser/Thr kinase [Bacillus methanolicus]|uniref:Serine/threonine-protein kinase PrkC n=1 Tax=Bacillus methanolicus (strain MGA3 / ATCC 53907) TaxID=796606 RepID=I3DZ63_BACMM|nr:Stk1 family PASTA domain-containing Ser/Thr kinase [Bacillus methanolicus]AIE59607.1 Serine/threonine-protein kinase PrkC [Bacillus methanolicus MGA3]EIJ79534.1 protein kinase [Bacillus methanolicus MGA3]
MIGKRISGRYKILKMIGGGGMANVYLAHDMILDRDVAVKMLRLDFANDEEFIRRFHREAQSATSLAHPNIVSIYDVGEENDLYYIVMEYVDGQTLKQYILQNSPIPTETALEIMQQLTSAISHAHQNDIVHRDIKPHNILLDKNGNVKVTDFGIAMALSATSITQTNSVLGSVHYLSPEQARGGMANKKSDIYSLGIVMFEMLTGRLPFSGESAVSIALKHLQSETPSLKRWNSSIPQSVENVVLKATAKDPFHRYDSVDEMEEDIRTALDPDRINEEKFVIPNDDEATKAIPVITKDRTFDNFDETIIHRKDTNSSVEPLQNKQGKNDIKIEKKKKWPWILVSIFILLMISGVLTVTVVPKLLFPDEVKVPDVTGMDVDKAKSKLIEAKFVIGETKKITSDEIDEGLVVKTDPQAGKMVKEGTTIDIYQSIGKKKFEMSDYTGRRYDDVIRILENKSFKDISKNDVYDDSEPGTIIDQNFSDGEEVVPEETRLEFTVSKGPEFIILKDLRDLNAKGVQDYADSVGLKVDMSKEEYHDTIPKGFVISQVPKAGAQLVKGDTITVVLSKGKKEIPPKTVIKEITIPYEPTQEGQPQEVQIYVEDMTRSMAEPYETLYITETKKLSLDLIIESGKKAEYKVIRDKSVLMDEVIPYPEEQ